MITLINTKVGISKGVARFWLEGSQLDHSFSPGDKLSEDINLDKKYIILKKDENGTKRVSQRTERTTNIAKPLIEYRDDILSKMFGVGVALRVTVRNGSLKVEAHSSEKSRSERVERFISKIRNKETLTIGSLFSGGGILDRAIHDGLESAGIDSYNKFVVERESKYLSSMVRNQPQLFRDDSILVHSSIEDVELRDCEGLDIIVAGIPCVGASKAGKTKKKLESAEHDEDAGAAFYSLLNFVKTFNPALAIFECVPDYIETSSMQVIKAMLNHWNYDLKIEVLEGNTFGALESRERMCLVATTNGLAANDDSFDFDLLLKLVDKPKSVSMVLENVPLDDKSWKTYSYLAAKEITDKEAGKGFKRSLYEGSEEAVTTIRRLYNKGGSCDQFLLHPNYEENGLMRLFTPVEHARIKGLPHELISVIDGLSFKTSHEILGQSVIYPVFKSVGEAIGRWGNHIGNTGTDSLKRLTLVKSDSKKSECVETNIDLPEQVVLFG